MTALSIAFKKNMDEPQKDRCSLVWNDFGLDKIAFALRSCFEIDKRLF